MTAETDAAKPAATKRGLFNRPKWAANTAKPESAPAPQQSNDFFSRSNETFASFAAQEQEREQRRAARRAAADVKPTTPAPGPNEKPSPKRRRISTEQEASDSDGEHLSDIEAERAEELAASVRAGKNVQKKAFSDLLDKGKALVKEGRAQLDFEDDERTPSPGLLPDDTPRSPNGEQCARLRVQCPELAACCDETMQRLARAKRERKEEAQVRSPAHKSSPRRQTRSSNNARSKLPVQTGDSPGRDRGSKQATVIALDDDEEALSVSPQKSAPAPTQKPLPTSQASITIEDDSDHELAAIERRARENARRKRLMEEPIPSLSPAPDGARSTPGASLDAECARAATQEPKAEANIQLLITSDIPDMKPIIVTRKIDQRLKEVRLYWCSYNELPEAIRPKVTLTWKKRRLYDSQSCTSLGFSTVDGRAVFNSKDHDIFDDFDGKLHLVAVAEGLPGVPATNDEPDSAAEVDGTGPELEPPSQPAPEEDIRVIIRARGLPECKIIVKPSTLISRMIDAFKKNGRIAQTKNVALMFDGELLQPNATVGQTDISDLEHIDAYVR